MYCVGLTGNIASGKTTVSRFFAEKGIAVISADDVARDLTAKNQPPLTAIVNHFGESIITSTGELNRAKLREKIFNNANDRQWLENLLHPLIRQLIEKKINQSSGPYVVIEIPLLYNRADYPYLNRILLVTAPRDQQIARVMARDNHSQEQAHTILSNQANELFRRKIADDLLINDASLAELAEKVENLHKKYLQFSS